MGVDPSPLTEGPRETQEDREGEGLALVERGSAGAGLRLGHLPALGLTEGGRGTLRVPAQQMQLRCPRPAALG